LQQEVEVGGHRRRVTVNRSGNLFDVTVDGRRHLIDAVRVDEHTLSLVVDAGQRGSGAQDRARVSGETVTWTGTAMVYDTVIGPGGPASQFVVLVGQQAIPVSLTRRRQAGVEDGARPAGPLRIVAPMPGKIVRVLVQRGEHVRARQPVVVVEAMKMENELRAERDGTIAEIPVREGETVESGAVLVVIQ
jgi:biotin carboxyl carrier protein